MFSSCGSIWNLMTIVNVGYEYIWTPFFVLLKLYERIEELLTNLMENIIDESFVVVKVMTFRMYIIKLKNLKIRNLK